MRVRSDLQFFAWSDPDLEKSFRLEPDPESLREYSFVNIKSILFYSILLYSILFYFILFYFILFYSILFYSILFYSILFHSFPQQS
jgi:hypothetical protein